MSALGWPLTSEHKSPQIRTFVHRLLNTRSTRPLTTPIASLYSNPAAFFFVVVSLKLNPQVGAGEPYAALTRLTSEQGFDPVSFLL